MRKKSYPHFSSKKSTCFNGDGGAGLFAPGTIISKPRRASIVCKVRDHEKVGNLFKFVNKKSYNYIHSNKKYCRAPAESYTANHGPTDKTRGATDRSRGPTDKTRGATNRSRGSTVGRPDAFVRRQTVIYFNEVFLRNAMNRHWRRLRRWRCQQR